VARASHRTGGINLPSSVEDVIAWYERKTKSILRKYGPGPQIHFHTGLVEPDAVAAEDIEGLRLQLVESQERLLVEAARFWEAEKHLRGVILDVGCGLGGSSIFLAQKYGSHVHALTNVPGHIELIKDFVNKAGVADKITTILGDSCAVPGNQVFDAVVAIESSCYLDRDVWFKHLAQKVRSEGHVFIADCFAISEEIREPFDSYWLTRIGTLNEYEHAFQAAGFNLEGLFDLTSRTARFWEFNILYSRRLLRALKVSEHEEERLLRSIKWQTQLLMSWRVGGIMCALLRLKHS
jgi:tocopherol O-methyltransferase